MWEFKGRSEGTEFHSLSLHFCEKRNLFLAFHTKLYFIKNCIWIFFFFKLYLNFLFKFSLNFFKIVFDFFFKNFIWIFYLNCIWIFFFLKLYLNFLFFKIVFEFSFFKILFEFSFLNCILIFFLLYLIFFLFKFFPTKLSGKKPTFFVETTLHLLTIWIGWFGRIGSFDRSPTAGICPRWTSFGGRIDDVGSPVSGWVASAWCVDSLVLIGFHFIVRTTSGHGSRGQNDRRGADRSHFPRWHQTGHRPPAHLSVRRPVAFGPVRLIPSGSQSRPLRTSSENRSSTRRQYDGLFIQKNPKKSEIKVRKSRKILRIFLRI